VTIPDQSSAPVRAEPGDADQQQSPHPRRWLVLSVIVVLVVFAAAVVVVVRNVTESSNPAEITKGLAPQPDRRFIWVGTTNGQQFSDAQFSYIAKNFDYVTFSKFHDNWDIQGAHDAAKRLVAMNPSIKVMPYFSALYWFEQNNWGTQPDPSWFLRDASGNVVHRTTQERGVQETVEVFDLSNPDYRDWAIGVMRSWLAAAPYSGIAFDEARTVLENSTSSDVSNDSFLQALSPEGVAAYNAGLRDLLSRATQLVGPNGTVIYNGILDTPGRSDRNLSLLEVTDGVVDEHFCLNAKGAPAQVQTDLDLMAQPSDKKLFLRTSVPDNVDSTELAGIARFCFGAFMLGWQPDRDFYSIGNDYSSDQIANEPKIVGLNLGQPQGDYRVDGDLDVRDFTNGTVIVNLGNNDATTTATTDGTSIGGDKGAMPVKAGDQITVRSQDAVFILYSV
jgi:hypothetical protein